MDLTEEEAALAAEAMQQYEDDSDSNNDFDTMSDGEMEPGGWIQWFVSLPEHDFLVEIEEQYIQDNFNLFGLK